MIQLRPYQLRARTAARAHYTDGKRRILYVAPTGAGKTVILSDTVLAHVRATPGARVLWHAHRRELVTQAAESLRRFGLDVGVFGAGASAPVQVLSTQATLARGQVERCTLGVFDEAHHYAAEVWGGVVTTLQATGATICGATATPERGDGLGLSHMFDGLVVVAQPKELVGVGALVPCEVIRPCRAVPRGKVAMSPLKAHVAYGRRKRNVVFAPHVKAAEDFAAEFTAAGFSARVVHGKMGADERDANLDALRSGTCEVLVNCMVLTEGWDCPPVENVTIARDCGSTGMYLQIAGRGARPSPETGKTSYRLLDLRGVSYVHGRPDDDREYSLDGLGIGRGSGEVVQGVRLCKVCGRDVDESGKCTGCAKDYSQTTPEDAGIGLEPWRAAMRSETEDKRVARLAKWIGESMRAGHKIEASYFKFRAVYGHYPTSGVRVAAMAIARATKEKRTANG